MTKRVSANTQLDHDNFLVCLSTETVEELTQLGQMRDTVFSRRTPRLGSPIRRRTHAGPFPRLSSRRDDRGVKCGHG